MDEILSYMYLMLREADSHGKLISRKAFTNHGKGLPLYEGVEGWFPRINRYAKDRGVKVHHYIISSGLREMLAGTDIAKEFEFIFASGFMYDQHGVAKWPALAVNYTNKTQHLFRINKGILNSYDNEKINKFVSAPDRPVPFSNMIYIGDGETDIPIYEDGEISRRLRRSCLRPQETQDRQETFSKRNLSDAARAGTSGFRIARRLSRRERP